MKYRNECDINPSIVRYISFLGEDLSLLITLTATVVILFSDTISVRNSAYAQQSDIRSNPISSTDSHTNQQHIPEERQQLIVIPSLSSDNLIPSIEQPEVKDEDTEQGQELERDLTSQQQTTTDIIEENREQAANEFRNSATQREMIQQQDQEEEKGVEIPEQQEDREQEIQEGLDEATRITTSNTIEEGDEEEEQNNEQNDDVEEERQDNPYDANNDIPLELPFP